MKRPRKFSWVVCKACGEKKRMDLDYGRPSERTVKLFEAGGWMYKEKKAGICGDCNLFSGG